MRLEAQDEKYRADRRQRRMNARRPAVKRYLAAVTNGPRDEIPAPAGADRQLSLLIREGAL